eukprot:10045327-Alexandrium_andersonii.AAC.1
MQVGLPARALCGLRSDRSSSLRLPHLDGPRLHLSSCWGGAWFGHCSWARAFVTGSVNRPTSQAPSTEQLQ